MIHNNPDLGAPVDPRLPYTKAEIIWICRNEMPVNLDDLLARRSRALFLNAKASSDIAPEAAWIMAAEMGYNNKWQEEQVESYRSLVKKYI
jgi:glycerol-3-phosphate dehydrogenase